jgi:hypothetical protein
MSVDCAAHVLEADPANLRDQETGGRVERLEIRMFHTVTPAHLLDKQQ